MLFWPKRDKRVKQINQELVTGSQQSVYESLNEIYDFRLLELLPGMGDQKIQCRLKLAKLVEKPLYSAVSYNWGEPPARRSIMLNGRKITVRKNLFLLLRELRHQHHDHTLWIDALCINQSDTAERGAQVRRMADIFGTAVKVIAWLRDFAVTTPGTLRRPMISGVLDFAQNVHLKRNSGGTLYLSAFYPFFAHEYWRRRWIIQEIALARSVVVACGGKTVPLDYIKLLAEYYGMTDSNAYRLCLLQEAKSQSGATLFSLILDYGGTECQDPKDKVFSLLSMTTKGMTRSFPVSYQHSLLDLLHITVRLTSTVDGLEESETTSFAFALSKQLGISSEQWISAAKIQPSKLPGHVSSRMLIRGHVSREETPSRLYDTIERWREASAPLKQYSPLRLVTPSNQTDRSPMLDPLTLMAIENSAAEPLATPKIISPRDMFALSGRH